MMTAQPGTYALVLRVGLCWILHGDALTIGNGAKPLPKLVGN